eukprot:4343534-Prymnesium_polylepis.1
MSTPERRAAGGKGWQGVAALRAPGGDAHTHSGPCAAVVPAGQRNLFLVTCTSQTTVRAGLELAKVNNGHKALRVYSVTCHIA